MPLILSDFRSMPSDYLRPWRPPWAPLPGLPLPQPHPLGRQLRWLHQRSWNWGWPECQGCKNANKNRITTSTVDYQFYRFATKPCFSTTSEKSRNEKNPEFLNLTCRKRVAAPRPLVVERLSSILAKEISWRLRMFRSQKAACYCFCAYPRVLGLEVKRWLRAAHARVRSTRKRGWG